MKGFAFMSMVIFKINVEGDIFDINIFAEEKLGLKKQEIVGKFSIYDLIPVENRNTLKRIIESCKNNIFSESFEIPLTTNKGKLVYFLWCFSATSMNQNHLEIAGIDITERVVKEKELAASNEYLLGKYEELTISEEELAEKYYELEINQKKLRKSEERYRLIAEASNTGIWDYDLVNNERFYSNKWFENLGLEPVEYDNIDEIWKNMVYPEDMAPLYKEVDKHFDMLTDHYEYEYRIKTKDGKCKWIKAIGKTIFDVDGNPVRRAGSDTDITELKDYQEKLRYFAYRDYLTNLPNRLMLNEKLTAMIREEIDKKYAVFFIDSDNFKLVNDTFGHQFGDQLIIQLGKRLEQLLEDKATVFRLGGDEFILLSSKFESICEIESLANKIMRGFDKPFIINGNKIDVTVSIGIAIYPLHGTNSDELIKNADIAMYKAKDQGKAKFVIFDKTMIDDILERMRIENNLHKALENHEFVIHYQPQIDIGTQSISGFEALVRWNSPEMGLVSPLRFIKIAEDCKLIIPLGEFVLKNACRFIKMVNELGYAGYTVSVNVSIIQLMQEDFVDMVLETLEEIKLDSKYLELEITESILMESFEENNNKLELLRRKGVGIALDDFGKGYSSLSYLKQLAISTLKIDKSFIGSITKSNKDDMLTGNIIQIGRQMGLSVVAEGVETREQLDYLISNKCEKIQGFLFSKPLPENEAISLLSARENIAKIIAGG